MDIFDQLAKAKPEPTDSQSVPGMSLPKRPKAPTGRGPEYTPVEVSNPGGSQIVGAFLTNILDHETCSDADREMAARALMAATGRKHVASVMDILQYTASFCGVMTFSLLALKAMLYPRAGTMYLNLVPGLLISTGIATLLMTAIYRQRPDVTLLILCGLNAMVLTIGLVNAL